MAVEKTDKEHNLAVALESVWPSITLSQQRMNEANRRLEAITGLAIISIPTMLALTDDRSLCWPLGLALLFALGVVVLAVGARSIFDFDKPNLEALAYWLGREEHYDYGVRLLDVVRCNLANNARANRRKWQAAICSMVLLIAELACLLWMVAV